MDFLQLSSKVPKVGDDALRLKSVWFDEKKKHVARFMVPHPDVSRTGRHKDGAVAACVRLEKKWPASPVSIAHWSGGMKLAILGNGSG